MLRYHGLLKGLRVIETNTLTNACFERLSKVNECHDTKYVQKAKSWEYIHLTIYMSTYTSIIYTRTHDQGPFSIDCMTQINWENDPSKALQQTAVEYRALEICVQCKTFASYLAGLLRGPSSGQQCPPPQPGGPGGPAASEWPCLVSGQTLLSTYEH